ncbi:MAG: thioredoxin domain-containing protein [Deltaproteobacteria bacterium]|nr:thioredoxin domain-containing protein [Deltaproteobacteria bacterium]
MSTLTPHVSSHDHAQGAPKAPITLVEFGDYECSYCARAYPIVKAVQEELGAELRFVFRNYPLTQLHPHALHAAEVAEAAGLHGKFWEMHDLLYQRSQALEDSELLDYAGELGLDPDAIAREAASDPVMTKLRADLESGEASAVEGTPTFYINGKRLEGSWDHASLLRALRAAR